MNRSYPGRSPSIRCPVCVSTSPVAVAAACMDARSVCESWRGGGGGEDGGGSGIWSWYRRRGCESDATCEYTVARALSSSSMRFCRVSLAMVDSLRPVHQPPTERRSQPAHLSGPACPRDTCCCEQVVACVPLTIRFPASRSLHKGTADHICHVSQCTAHSASTHFHFIRRHS